MASTRTPRITIDSDGRRFLDKRDHGVRIGIRVGSVTQELAERRLHTEIQRVDLESAQRAHPGPLFRDCAARYLAQSRDKRSLEAIQVRVTICELRSLAACVPQATQPKIERRCSDTRIIRWRALRECRRRSPARAGQPRPEARGIVHGASRREWRFDFNNTPTGTACLQITVTRVTGALSLKAHLPFRCGPTRIESPHSGHQRTVTSGRLPSGVARSEPGEPVFHAGCRST